MKNYLFSYAYNGEWYSFHVPADSQVEAEARVKRMAMARCDGEHVLSIPVPSMNLIGWLRRLFGRRS